MGFDQLQRRLGRKTVGSTLKRECPMRFVAYDLLEKSGTDIRQLPLHERQQQLDDVLNHVDHGEAWRLHRSPSWELNSWSALEEQRNNARQHKAEGHHSGYSCNPKRPNPNVTRTVPLFGAGRESHRCSIWAAAEAEDELN